jgi:DnaJ-class molecular chaperone
MKKPKPRENVLEIICPACNGTGFPAVMQPVQPDRKIFPTACKRCAGKGRIAPTAKGATFSFLSMNLGREPRLKEVSRADGIEVTCPACNGTGFPTVMQPGQPGRRIYPAPCRECHGKGWARRSRTFGAI